MISAEDGDELDEAAQSYATDTTWSWVKRFKKKKIICMCGKKHKSMNNA